MIVGRDGFAGLVVLAASLVLYWGTLGLERSSMVPVGPAFYPRIVLGVTAALSLILVAVDVLGRRRGLRPQAAGTTSNYGLVLASFGVFTAYVIALPFFGFRLATFAFLVALQATLESPRGLRRWVSVILVALVSTAVIYYAFDQYLQVLLPRGRWTGF